MRSGGRIEEATVSCTIKQADTRGDISLWGGTAGHNGRQLDGLRILRRAEDGLQQIQSCTGFEERRDAKEIFRNSVCVPFAFYHTRLPFFQGFKFVILWSAEME